MAQAGSEPEKERILLTPHHTQEHSQQQLGEGEALKSSEGSLSRTGGHGVGRSKRQKGTGSGRVKITGSQRAVRQEEGAN